MKICKLPLGGWVASESYNWFSANIACIANCPYFYLKKKSHVHSLCRVDLIAECRGCEANSVLYKIAVILSYRYWWSHAQKRYGKFPPGLENSQPKRLDIPVSIRLMAAKGFEPRAANVNVLTECIAAELPEICCTNALFPRISH